VPLMFHEDPIPMIEGFAIRATDSAGKLVPVRASQEVVQDHGLHDVQRMASDKYDKGQFQPDGSVVVRNSDFA
jgi:hypothetical protein